MRPPRHRPHERSARGKPDGGGDHVRQRLADRPRAISMLTHHHVDAAQVFNGAELCALFGAMLSELTSRKRLARYAVEPEPVSRLIAKSFIARFKSDSVDGLGLARRPVHREHEFVAFDQSWSCSGPVSVLAAVRYRLSATILPTLGNASSRKASIHSRIQRIGFSCFTFPAACSPDSPCGQIWPDRDRFLPWRRYAPAVRDALGGVIQTLSIGNLQSMGLRASARHPQWSRQQRGADRVCRERPQRRKP